MVAHAADVVGRGGRLSDARAVGRIDTRRLAPLGRPPRPDGIVRWLWLRVGHGCCWCRTSGQSGRQLHHGQPPSLFMFLPDMMVGGRLHVRVATSSRRFLGRRIRTSATRHDRPHLYAHTPTLALDKPPRGCRRRTSDVSTVIIGVSLTQQFTNKRPLVGQHNSSSGRYFYFFLSWFSTTSLAKPSCVHAAKVG